MIELIAIPATTAADGTFTGYSIPVRGRVLQVAYVPGSPALDTASVIALTGESSGIVIASHGSLGTAAFNRAYQAPVYGTTGTAALYAAGGTAVLSPIALAGERIKLVISAGGNAGVGTFNIYVQWDS